MTQKLKLRKIGNSYGIVLPKEILSRHNLEEGDVLYVIDSAEGIKLAPYDPELGEAMKVFEEGRKRYRNALRELAK